MLHKAKMDMIIWITCYYLLIILNWFDFLFAFNSISNLSENKQMQVAPRISRFSSHGFEQSWVLNPQGGPPNIALQTLPEQCFSHVQRLKTHDFQFSAVNQTCVASPGLSRPSKPNRKQISTAVVVFAGQYSSWPTDLNICRIWYPQRVWEYVPCIHWRMVCTWNTFYLCFITYHGWIN